MADAQIKAVITAEDRASSVLRDFGKSVDNGVTNALEGARAGSFALLGGLTALAGGAYLTVKAFSESENMAAQLDAVLKSTGGAAGVTRDAALSLSQALQSQTTFSDEAVLSAENLLLTFTSIGKDIFPQATQTVLDMSIALGQDTKSSAIQLGKALQDPILGVTALRRVGVNFSEAQQKVIADLVNTGQSAKAQTLILQELNKEFGGSATAAAATFTGQLKQLWNMIDDVMEIIGKIIADAIRPFIQSLMDTFKALGGAEGVGRKFVDMLKTLQPYLPVIVGAIAGGLVPAVVALISALGLLNPWFLAFVAVGAAVGLIVKETGINFSDLKQVFDFLKPSLDLLWQAITTNLWPALQNLWAAIQPLLPAIGTFLIGALYVLITTLTAVINVISFVINIVASLATFFLTTLPNAIGSGVNIVSGWIDYLKNHFWETVGFIIGFFATLPIKIPLLVIEAITSVIVWLSKVDWGAVFSSIGRALDGVWSWVKNSAISAFNFIKNLDWGSISANIGKGLGNGILGLIEGAINGAASGIPGFKGVHLPRFASGVQNFSGGLAVVGERGPELVNLPRGADVIPNNQIGSSSNTTVNISLNGPFMGSGSEARAYAQMIVDNIKDIASAKNMSVAEIFS